VKIVGVKAAALTLLLLFEASLLAQQEGAAPPPGDEDQPTTTSTVSAATSHVRIVRLSEVTGEVNVYRGIGESYETALLNLPITESLELRTGEGFAEVEFEDGSTLRLAPFTIVEFTQLARDSAGATATTVNVVTGTTYVSLANTPESHFTLTFAHQRATLSPSSHVRLFMSDHAASLAVLHGEAAIETPTGETAEAKNKTVNFEFLTPTAISQNKNVQDPYDTWDSEAIDYHKHYAKAAAYGTGGGTFGVSDMNYYGRFVTTPCGDIWRPYFAGAVWDPFANGSWVWYPQWGYTWVSPYPWGWTPYHYGGWDYCPNYGWGWRPYGAWRSIPNPPSRLVKLPPPAHHGFRPPHPPMLPPKHGTPTVIAVNPTPANPSRMNPRAGFVIPRDSAGLGVPRETFGKLDRVSGRLDRQGGDSIALNSHPIAVQGSKSDGNSYAAPYRGTGTAVRAPIMAGHASSSGEGPHGSYSRGVSQGSSGASYHTSGASGYSGGGGGGGHSSSSGGSSGGSGGGRK